MSGAEQTMTFCRLPPQQAAGEACARELIHALDDTLSYRCSLRAMVE